MNKDISIKWVAASGLKPNPKNNNKHTPEQVERLARILKYQGFRSPIVVSNQSGFITKGHCTLEAAKLNGWESVPVSYQDYEDEAQEFAHMTSDNAIAEWSSIDMAAVMSAVENLDIPDVDILGFQEFGLKEYEAKEGSKEYSEEEFSEFEHKCPRCNFEFNK